MRFQFASRSSFGGIKIGALMMIFHTLFVVRCANNDSCPSKFCQNLNELNESYPLIDFGIANFRRKFVLCKLF